MGVPLLPALQRALAVGTATVLALFAVPALGHEAPPGLRVTLAPLDPALKSLDVDVAVSVAPQLVVANPSATPLEVLDDEGVAFLRIGPDGVHANLNASAWYRSNDPSGFQAVPERAQTGARAEWAKIARQPSWGWFDHRLHPGDVRVPAGIAAQRKRPGHQARMEPMLLGRWSVPVRYGEAETALLGTIEYRPVRGSFVAELRSSPRPLEGVTVALLQGRVPGLFVDNSTGSPLLVLGSGREPFLRIGPDHVEANVRSPSWAATAQMSGSPIGANVNADAAPRWERVAEGTRYGWLEPRGLYPEDEPPQELLAHPATVVEWSVPMQLGDQSSVLRAETRWVPLPLGEDRSQRDRLLPAAATALVVLAGLAAVLLRLRMLTRRRA